MLELWTDGACERNKNPGIGGWGFVATRDGEVVNRKSGGDGATTNNRMELTAILEALRSCEDKASSLVHSDSMYSINCCTTWRARWESNGMKRKKGGDDVKNADLLKLIWSEIDRVQPSFKWVRGHSGVAGNEAADKLASEAAFAIGAAQV